MSGLQFFPSSLAEFILECVVEQFWRVQQSTFLLFFFAYFGLRRDLDRSYDIVDFIVWHGELISEDFSPAEMRVLIDQTQMNRLLLTATSL